MIVDAMGIKLGQRGTPSAIHCHAMKSSDRDRHTLLLLCAGRSRHRLNSLVRAASRGIGGPQALQWILRAGRDTGCRPYTEDGLPGGRDGLQRAALGQY